MTRTTTFLALLQVLLVVVGFFALGIILKMAGYPDDTTVRWNPLATFLRQHGVWLLLLPALWVFVATLLEQIEWGVISRRVALASGVCLAGLILGLFLYAAVFPYARPVFFPVR